MGAPGASRTARPSLTRDQWRVVLFCTVLALYIALTLSIVFKSPILTVDTHLAHMHFRRRFPALRPVIFWYVVLGQRGPATLLFLPVFLWMAWRRRSTAPLVALVTALVLLNLSVGVVKYATGRVGPRALVAPGASHRVGAHDIFAGGDIYPSGHVSNAVVLYGVIALLVVNRKRLVSAVAVLLSLTIGLGTIFLDTHWFSDVLGGWLAGALVLIALPWATPTAQRAADAVEARLRGWWRRRRATRSAGAPTEIAPGGTGPRLARHRAAARRPIGLHEERRDEQATVS